jgi:selenocysteine-specific elongation factor
MKHVIVGTAGHIDHGKSSLVEALTGTHPDRLEEEKRRGITIDLGFAFLNLEGVRLGFVDVPGHERFVRNMLAGVGGIDLMLLVVAADESIKPQTREHFDICRILGIQRGLVALTKADLVETDVLGLVRLEIEEFVAGSFLANSAIVEVSATTGAGLEALKAELLRAALAVPLKDESRYFRLPIDRAFAMKGFGAVVTGTLVSGALQVEDEVELFPLQRKLRVRGLHSGGSAVQRAVAGQRTAVNLAGVELGELRRGMVLAAPGLFRATDCFDARISLLASARTLKNRARVHFHQGAAEAVAQVVLLDRDALAPNESALAQLRLSQPLLLLPGDRFILRQFSPVMTVGGGVVVENLAARHRRSDKDILPHLERLEGGTRQQILEEMAKAEPRGLAVNVIVMRTGWLESEVRETAQQLAAARRLAIVSEPEQPLVIASVAALEDATRRLSEAVEAFHRTSPLVPGISKEELRGRTGPGARPEIFRAALDVLVAGGALVVRGDLVQQAGHEIALLPEEARAKEQIEKEFERAGLAVPRFDEVLAKLPVERKRALKLLQILLREKVLLKVTDDLIFHRSAVSQLRELLTGYKAQHGPRLPIAAFKALTAVSRKYAIPLLEFLDHQGLTRRAGNERVIL